MSGTSIGSPLARGAKRTADVSHETILKRARLNHVKECTETSSSSESDSESAYSLEEVDQSSPLTPQTPVSSKPSPRFPSDLKTHRCPEPGCSKSFNRPARLTEHLRSHTNTRPFVCPHPPCTKDFLRESHLQHHIKSAHTNVRDYSCDWEGCDKKFLTNTRLKRHLAAHQGREKHKCPVPSCGQTFRKHSTLQKHTAMVHEGRKAFVCQETNDDGTSCNAGFDTAGKLSTHSGRVHGAKRYWCTVCPPSSSTIDASLSIPAESPSFSTYAALQSHIKTVHPPTCQDCGLQLSTARELAQHLELHHSTQTLSERQKHICPEPSCGRGFTTKGNLKVHIRTVHAGEKRFVCGTTPISELHNIGDWAGLDGCGEEFGTKGNLETHIRGVHLGVDRSLKAKRKAKKRGSGGKKRQMTAPTGGEGGERSEMIKRLTGAGYSDDPTRTIPCVLAPQCGFRFAREYDRDVHLRSKHGLTEGQARELLLLGGADPGSGVNEGYGYAAAAPVTAAAVGDGTGYVEGVFGTAPVPVSGSWGLEEAIEQTGRNGGPFWVGGVGRDWSQDEASDLGERDGEWEADEVVMGGEEVCIDPILR